jgi:calcineurin-like phosphoesterase family protein
MNKIFFTADTHFGHKNICRLCNRPFSSVEEMDRELITRWNYVVEDGDVVYHLGDFAFKDPDYYKEKLNGSVVFLKGDHDSWMKGVYFPSLIIIKPLGLLDEYGNQREITLCHWAMRSWQKSHYASWHLFGHHHGKLEPYGLSFDVGVDTHNFFPYSMTEISEKMATLKPVVDFRQKRHD